MSLQLPDGDECFFDPLHECDGWHGDERCDWDPCGCPDDFGHRSPGGLAKAEADRKEQAEANEREWAALEADIKAGRVVP